LARQTDSQGQIGTRGSLFRAQHSAPCRARDELGPVLHRPSLILAIPTDSRCRSLATLSSSLAAVTTISRLVHGRWFCYPQWCFKDHSTLRGCHSTNTQSRGKTLLLVHTLQGRPLEPYKVFDASIGNEEDYMRHQVRLAASGIASGEQAT
jgi:hypothetical protein